MICVMVEIASGEVVNALVADPDVDPAPEGYRLLLAPDKVGIGWLWNGKEFVMSQAMLDAIAVRQAAEDALPWNAARMEIEADPQAFLQILVFNG